MSEYKYVTENAEIFHGEAAKALLENGSDEKYLNKDGIISIGQNRWLEAQRYESTEWLQRARGMKEDRNNFHKDIFQNYEILKDISVTSMIELGCGPFTNAKLIESVIPNITDITLLDPLANSYITSQPNCTYKDRKLNNKDVTVIASSIEEFKVERTYDSVVMINVLEHCFSIPKIFENIEQMMAKGSYFIYADVQFDYETIEKISKSKYNAGHPLRATKEYINNFLTKNFETLFSTTFDEEVAGEQAEELYFIGVKK